MFSKALIILASISAAFAKPYITQPVASSVYQGGQNGTVTWQDDGTSPTLANFGACSIAIYAGNSIQQTQLQVINGSVDLSKTSTISFTVDPTIGPNSNEYFIRITSLAFMDPSQPQYPAEAFSAKFTLANMSGTFSASVLSEISGQSTAPLASPTGSSNSGSPGVSSTGFTTSMLPSPTSSSHPSSTASSSGAESIIFHGGWMAFLFSALFSVSMF